MTHTKTKIFITVLLLALTGNLQAQDAADEITDNDELEQFLKLLKQQTTLATDTRINADFVPGMFSVLSAEQMQRRGFRTLWEALASIPGVQTTMNETGMRSITVRGIGELFDPSKVKLLLNGKAVNLSAGATTGTIYDTPVEQIERVEFIRGPGSAIHGEFAYAGVLNVITRKHGEQYSVGVESGEGRSFSALYSYQKPGGDIKTSFNFAASESEGEDISSGLDRTPLGVGTPSYASGPINNKRDFVSAIGDVEIGNLDLMIQFQQANRGDHFGTNNLLPPDDRQTVISDSMLSVDVSQTFDIDEQRSVGWSLNLLQNESEQNELFLGVAEAFGGVGDDIVADSLLEERRIEAKVHLQYEVGAHKLFGELVFTDIEVLESEQFINLDPITNLPSPTMNEFPGPVDESQDRKSHSIVLQDEYRIDDQFTLTTGLRFDDYEDIDTNVSPRIALVWRRPDHHIFKVQLARAFRPPSLIEVGGSIESSIDAETNDTLEFGHVYHGMDLVLRNTIYFSRLDDLIVFQDSVPFGYKNTSSQKLRGYELEIEKSINRAWKVNSSLSLQDYANEGLAGAVPWMFKLGTEYSPFPLTQLHVQINSIGTRDREASDSRSDFSQQNQVDASLRVQNLNGIDGLSLRAGILNILDDDLHHPAPADTYPGDYPYSDGATLWLQLIYQPR